MRNATDLKIKGRIETFVTELDRLVRKSALEALRGVLDGGAAPTRRGRPAGSGRGPGRPSASVGGDASAAIVSFVQAHDGQGVREIAAGTGVSGKVAKKIVAKLLASGQLKKSGQKRGTRYHVGSGRAPVAKGKRRGKRRGKRAKAA